MRISSALIAFHASCFLLSCTKAVVSHQKIPVGALPPTQAQAPANGKKNEPTNQTNSNTVVKADLPPDSKASLRLVTANCKGERKTTFSLRVAGVKDAEWLPISCDDKDKVIELDVLKGECNVLQLKADVTFDKPTASDKYQRSTALKDDLEFFKVQQIAGSASHGLRVLFEDTNNDYWKNAWKFCEINPDGTVKLVPITLMIDQKCSEIRNGYTENNPASADFGKFISPAVDWSEFVFSIESDEAKLAVEGFPSNDCI